MESKRSELVKAASGTVVTRDWGLGNRRMLFKGPNLQLVYKKSPADLRHSTVIMDNNTVLQTSKLLRDYILIVLTTKKKR